MSTNAVAAYLRKIRMARNISQTKLADAIGLSKRQIIRWETGQSDLIKADALMQATEFLGASQDHVTRLLRDPKATAAEGERFADEFLSRPQPKPQPKRSIQLTDTQMEYVRMWMEAMPDDGMDALIGILRDNDTHSQLVAYIEGYYAARHKKAQQEESSQQASDTDTVQPFHPQPSEG